MKGRTELQLNALMKDYPSLRTYSMRPGIVDPRADPQVLAAQKDRRGAAYKALEVIVGPIVRTTYSSMHSPTQWLGKFLTDLAIGDGEPLKGQDLEGDGRIVGNKAARRIAKEWETAGR